VNTVNIIGGFLSTDTYLAPPKYVETLLAEAGFAPVPTFKELLDQTFQQYIDAVIEHHARRARIDRAVLNAFGIDVEDPLRFAK
jgi:hypothetical protein